MANQKLTDLAAATTPLAGTEVVYLVQGGVSKRATAQQMADLPGEWSAETVSQAEAEAGTATARRAWTALRVAQAIAAWWAGSAAKTKLDGIASGATANATDAQLRDRSTHTGTQAVGTITGLAAVATSGAYSDLSGRPTLGSAAATETTAYATAAQGAKADTAVQPAALSGYVQNSDVRLTDAREWSADTISQAEAETGTATTRRAFTAQRVRQAVTAWWNTITTISLPAGSAPGAPATGLTLFANASNALSWIGANGFTRTFDGTANTANRAYTLQNKSGTLAHLDDIPAAAGLATTATAGLMPATSFAAITYAADVELDMAALDGQVRTISLTGNLSLTSINRAAGRSVTLRIIADGTQRTLTFPSGWVFIGSKPANIAASKTGVLSLTFFGTASTDAVAAWGVQA